MGKSWAIEVLELCDVSIFFVAVQKEKQRKAARISGSPQSP